MPLASLHMGEARSRSGTASSSFGAVPPPPARRHRPAPARHRWTPPEDRAACAPGSKAGDPAWRPPEGIGASADMHAAAEHESPSGRARVSSGRGPRSLRSHVDGMPRARHGDVVAAAHVAGRGNQALGAGRWTTAWSRCILLCMLLFFCLGTVGIVGAA